MKRYRVMYKMTERANDELARTEEVSADGWRADDKEVHLYQRLEGEEVSVLDIPKARVMRILEVR